LCDVAVFRATGAGVAAAWAAHKAGARVALVEPTDRIGGMVSGGLSWTDVGDERVLRGFARRFYDVATYFPEPHVAEEILTSMLDGIDVVRELPDDAAVYVDASYGSSHAQPEWMSPVMKSASFTWWFLMCAKTFLRSAV